MATHWFTDTFSSHEVQNGRIFLGTDTRTTYKTWGSGKSMIVNSDLPIVRVPAQIRSEKQGPFPIDPTRQMVSICRIVPDAYVKNGFSLGLRPQLVDLFRYSVNIFRFHLQELAKFSISGSDERNPFKVAESTRSSLSLTTYAEMDLTFEIFISPISRLHAYALCTWTCGCLKLPEKFSWSISMRT
ncbi:hypothetical protein L218DRAFT_246034 [Marasmius fiardii PR-910]|nr:hypothetical protein L218DRAFT_246034 [Marasmius fiardii PR-910]